MKLNLCKLELAVACCDLYQDYTGFVLSFISRIELIDYSVDGASGERLYWGIQMGIWSKNFGGHQTLRTP